MKQKNNIWCSSINWTGSAIKDIPEPDIYVAEANNRIFYCSQCGSEFRIKEAIDIHVKRCIV